MNQIKPDETLVGVSTLKGWDYTRELHKEMIRGQGLDTITHSVEETYQGEVPYDFPPSNLVANGFLSIGDSAFQNKPFNGEGMASGMMAAQLALPAILEAAHLGDFSTKNLWKYNLSFFKGFGSDFAMIRGTGETLVELSTEEFDWMFDNGFMDQKMLDSTWKTFKAKTSGKTMLAAFRGLKRIKLFKKIIKGILLGAKLQSHYKKYPDNLEKLDNWEQKFKKLMQ
jgi:flavin-dependent dehydrogenase